MIHIALQRERIIPKKQTERPVVATESITGRHIRGTVDGAFRNIYHELRNSTFAACTLW